MTNLTWCEFRAECPEGARCRVCGDKIKNEPAVRDDDLTTPQACMYQHVECTEEEPC
jgi:hypothetical protein